MVSKQKTAIVTGASQGIGAAVAQSFLELGYNLVANSRKITKANPFAAAANVALVDGDIGNPNAAAKIVDAALSQFGRIENTGSGGQVVEAKGVMRAAPLHRGS